MSSVISVKIEEKSKRIVEHMDTIARLEELKAKLREWPVKTIDKRFFERYFSEVRSYGNITKYKIEPKRYEWSKHNHEIYISQGCTLELQTREKDEISKAIGERLALVRQWKYREQEDINTLQGIDEKQVKAEIIAIYKKHNLGIIWREILLDVKFPD